MVPVFSEARINCSIPRSSAGERRRTRSYLSLYPTGHQSAEYSASPPAKQPGAPSSTQTSDNSQFGVRVEGGPGCRCRPMLAKPLPSICSMIGHAAQPAPITGCAIVYWNKNGGRGLYIRGAMIKASVETTSFTSGIARRVALLLTSPNPSRAWKGTNEGKNIERCESLQEIAGTAEFNLVQGDSYQPDGGAC